MRYSDIQLARSLAESPYPLAWFENYTSAIYERIKQLRNEGENQ
jgi:hypothetical protein